MRFSWCAIWLEEREPDLRRQARAWSIGTPEENWRQLNGRRTKSRPAAATLGTSRTTLDPHPLLSPMLPLLVSEVKREPFVKTQWERTRPSPASSSFFVDRQMAELMVES